MIRNQVYEYSNEGKEIAENTTQSIYHSDCRGVRVGPTDFVVIENICATPDIGECYIQIQIGTTKMFLNPDGTVSDGIPASVIPHPIENQSIFRYRLKLIPIYVLPGQIWDIFLYNKKPIKNGENVKVIVETTIYDGADSAIATYLLKNAREVTPENAERMKAELIHSSRPGTYRIKKVKI